MRQLFIVTVSFDHPVAGTVQLYADSEEHAKQILNDAHANMKNFTIIDLHQLTEDQLKAMRVQLELPFDEIEKDKLN